MDIMRSFVALSLLTVVAPACSADPLESELRSARSRATTVVEGLIAEPGVELPSEFDSYPRFTSERAFIRHVLGEEVQVASEDSSFSSDPAAESETEVAYEDEPCPDDVCGSEYAVAALDDGVLIIGGALIIVGAAIYIYSTGNPVRREIGGWEFDLDVFGLADSGAEETVVRASPVEACRALGIDRNECRRVIHIIKPPGSAARNLNCDRQTGDCYWDDGELAGNLCEEARGGCPDAE